MKLECFSAPLFCTALLLSGCGAREPQEPVKTTPSQTDEALSIRGSSVAGSEQQVKEWAAKFEN